MTSLQQIHMANQGSYTDKFSPTGIFSKFMDLPIKIRREIYNHVLAFENQLGRFLSAHGTIGELSAKRKPFLLPAICLTSKTERRIATFEFMQHAKLVVCCEWCGEQTLSFLDRLDCGREAVRTLIYDHYAHDHSKNDRSFSMRVMENLPQLKSVQIILSVWDIIELESGVVSGPYRTLTEHEILAKKDFRAVINNDSLTYFHILVVKAGNLHEDHVMEGFLKIGEQMNGAFLQRGRADVRLRFTHYDRNDPKNSPSYSARAAAAAAASKSATG